MIKKIALIGALAVALVVFPSAKSKQPKAVTNFEKDTKALIQEMDIVGTSVALIQKGEVIYSQGFGVADQSSEAEFTPQSVLKIAAVARPVITLAVLQQVEQGRINLDKDISEYLGFKLRNPAYPEVAITVRMLLNTTSTIVSTVPSIADLDETRNPEYSKYFEEKGKPGVKHNSSTAAYNLAAAIVEKVTGERFDAYCAANIFQPMGMTAGFCKEDFQEGAVAKSYNWSAKSNKYINQKRAYPALELENYVLGESTFALRPGGMMTNVEGLTAFVLTLMNQGVCPTTGNRIISEAMCLEMLRPQANKKKAGLGVLYNTTAVPDYVIAVGTGANAGTSACFYFNLQDKIGMVALCNGAHDAAPDSDGKVGNHFNREIRKIFTDNFVK